MMNSTQPSPNTWRHLPRADKIALLEVLAERERRKSVNRLSQYRPYTKQRAFHDAGAVHRERLLMAGNQLGKTMAGAAEAAYHLTGLYPDWWEGRRFVKPIRMWAGSVTSEVTRDNIQRNLLGMPSDRASWGTGLLPGDSVIRTSLSHGIADCVSTITVRHVTGGVSSVGFKSYDQGRTKWQGDTLDVVWFDEEPPLPIYMEGLTRTNATKGFVYLTFTPLFGMSDVVHSFLSEI